MVTDELSEGERFGRYRLLRRLAMGGMAEVSLARLDGVAGFNKLLVLKQILPDVAAEQSFIELFLDEGRLAAQLSHPNIAQTFELGQEEGRYFIAMEYVPGVSLSDVLLRERERKLPMPLSCALRITAQVCEALDYAHTARSVEGRPLNVVHRDVSPSNVMLTWHGSVLLVDFGIAAAATHVHKTEAGYSRGKVGYMSPEQMRGERVDARTDIYALGAVLYQLATGKRPFEAQGGSLVATFAAVAKGQFPRPREANSEVPAELEAIILKAMALQPGDRFGSAGALLEELTRFAGVNGLTVLPRELAAHLTQLFPDRAESMAKVESGHGDKVTASGHVTIPATATVTERPRVRPPEQRTIVAAIVAVGLLLATATAIRIARTPPPVTPPAVVVVTPPVEQPPPPEPTVEPEPEPEPAVEPTTPSAPQDKPARRAARAPAPSGYLKLDAYPWVKVMHRGKLLGVTPLRAEVPAGTLELTLVNPEVGIQKKLSVVVRPGEETARFLELTPR